MRKAHYSQRVNVMASFCIAWSFFLLTAASTQGQNRISTKEDREALYEYLLQSMERESISPVKNERLNLDIKQEMLKYKDALINANSDKELFYALVRISNARKDRHLNVGLVPGGIKLGPFETENMILHPQEQVKVPRANVKLEVDYGVEGNYSLFVANFGEEFGNGIIRVGDKVAAVNGIPFKKYVNSIEPYHRYSTEKGLWKLIAAYLPKKTKRFPASFYKEQLLLTFQRDIATAYTISFPYNPPDNEVIWAMDEDIIYPDFELKFASETFDVYMHKKNKPVILLQWHLFRKDLVQDIDTLMQYARENQLLDNDLIIDATKCRGGSKGSYAIQRLTPKSFKTTFGNLKISDITDDFVALKNEEFKTGGILDHGVTETVDDGTWLMSWLNDDVMKAFRDGQEYSNNVPFKLAHLPKEADGMMHPAKEHFTGKMVCFFGPYGGSHVDQFASIIIDNNLGHSMGMACGGYSNTWEWEETLKFPISGRPVVDYMWSIGHTIRPNGEILEGNPAEVKEYIPVTRENYANYHSILTDRAMKYLGF